MKAIAVFSLALFVVVVGAPASPAADANDRGKALSIGKQPDHPYGSHMYLHTCRMLAECLRLNGLQASVSDGWPKNEDDLRDVKTIVVYTSPAAELLLDGPQRERVDRMMKAGVGLVTIHWASSVMQQDFDRLGERWLSYLGGTWVSNVGLSTDTAELKQLMPEHPICRGWSGYELHDEYYLNPTISKAARPLLQVTTKGQDVVVSWAYERPDGGRAYGTTLGHFYSNFEREPFRRAIVNAILWTAKRDVPEAGARVDISDDILKLPPEKPRAPSRQDPARGNGSSRRTLKFPADRAVGTVYWRMPDGKPFLYAKHDQGWKPIGKTRRTVRVPAEAQVRLDVVKAASSDLAWLDDLQPDDIQLLNLRGTDVSDERLRHVARLTGLRALELDGTPISDAGFKGFERLTKLEEIDLGAFGEGREGSGAGDGAVRVLARLPKLRRLGLWSTKVTGSGLAELANCRSLTHLELNGTKVGDAGLAELVACQSLIHLRVEDTEISDAGLVHLAKLPQLEILWLGDNEGVTDEALKTVGQLVHLTTLDLMSTKITGAGLARLKDLKKLKRLFLDHNDIGEADLAHLEPLESLEDLRLYYIKGRITDVGAEHLARLKSLRALSGWFHFGDKGVALLAALPHLEQLLLNGHVTDASAGDIAKMKSLKKLWFQGCPITDAMLQSIAGLPNLEDLVLLRTRVTGDGFRYLRDASKLSTLSVEANDQKPANQPRPHLRELGKLAQINDLRIEGGSFVSGDLKDLAGLVNLERLDVSIPVDDDGASLLAGLKRLKWLQVSDGAITDVGLEHLSLLPHLEFLGIEGRFTDEGLMHLARLGELQRLWVASADITDAGLEELARRLPNLRYGAERRTTANGGEEVVSSDKDKIRRDAEDRAVLEAMEDKPPPALSVEGWLNAGEKGLDLKQLEGKVVLVDFWGTWCGPCRALTPKLKQLHAKYADKGLLIVGIHTTRFADTLPDYVKQESIVWPMAADVDDATVEAWKVPHYPTLFLIDRSGKVRLAGLWRGDLERAIVQLLEEPVPARR